MKMFQRFVFCDQIAQGREFFRVCPALWIDPESGIF